MSARALRGLLREAREKMQIFCSLQSLSCHPLSSFLLGGEGDNRWPFLTVCACFGVRRSTCVISKQFLIVLQDRSDNGFLGALATSLWDVGTVMGFRGALAALCSVCFLRATAAFFRANHKISEERSAASGSSNSKFSGVPGWVIVSF